MTTQGVRRTPIKAAILGSCISRDPFAFFPDDRFQIPQFIARTSPISLMSAPLDIGVETIANHNNFETRSIYMDFTKESLALLDAEVDVLLVDFIEDRFDIAEIGDSFVLCTPNVLRSGVLEQFPKHRIIPRADPDVAFLWAQGWLKLLARIKAAGLEDKLILNVGAYCTTYQTPDGAIKPFDSHYLRFAEFNQILLNHYNGLARASVPGLRTIEIDKTWRLARSDHKWGLQPFHYIDAYYVRTMEALCALTQLPPRETLAVELAGQPAPPGLDASL